MSLNVRRLTGLAAVVNDNVFHDLEQHYDFPLFIRPEISLACQFRPQNPGTKSILEGSVRDRVRRHNDTERKSPVLRHCKQSRPAGRCWAVTCPETRRREVGVAKLSAVLPGHHYNYYTSLLKLNHSSPRFTRLGSRLAATFLSF